MKISKILSKIIVEVTKRMEDLQLANNDGKLVIAKDCKKLRRNLSSNKMKKDDALIGGKVEVFIDNNPKEPKIILTRYARDNVDKYDYNNKYRDSDCIVTYIYDDSRYNEIISKIVNNILNYFSNNNSYERKEHKFNELIHSCENDDDDCEIQQQEI